MSKTTMTAQNVKNVSGLGVTATTSSSSVYDAEGNFLFRKEWLADYGIIDKPGLYKNITVVGEPNLYDPAEYGEEGNPRFIVNLKAILKSDLPKIAEAIGDAEFVRAEELRGMTMNGNIWPNQETGEVPTLPHRRQKVNINVDFVEDRDGNKVLRVTDIYPPEAIEPEKVDLDTLFARISEDTSEKEED